jgi:hypothetical protein
MSELKLDEHGQPTVAVREGAVIYRPLGADRGTLTIGEAHESDADEGCANLIYSHGATTYETVCQGKNRRRVEVVDRPGWYVRFDHDYGDLLPVDDGTLTEAEWWAALRLAATRWAARRTELAHEDVPSSVELRRRSVIIMRR